MKMSTLEWIAVIVGIPTCTLIIIADIIFFVAVAAMNWEEK